MAFEEKERNKKKKKRVSERHNLQLNYSPKLKKNFSFNFFNILVNSELLILKSYTISIHLLL